MPCPASCCSFASAPGSGSGSDSAHVTEKHYGCYKAGILFALAIILLLLVGCVPVFVLTANNNLILLILLVTLVLIGVTTFAYFRWQRHRAQAMRRTYEQQKFALTRVPQPKPPPAKTAGPTAEPNGTAGPGGMKSSPDGDHATTTAMYAAYGQNGTSKLAPPAGGMSKQGDPPADHDESFAPSTRTTTQSPPRYSFI